MITPDQMATLMQMARDIYPHDKVGDQYYAIAVKGYDAADSKDMIAAGIDGVERGGGGAGPCVLPCDRLGERPRQGAASHREGVFFQKVRAGLVTGLYNQKEIWPIFGYEGESFSKGGYIHRGFDDINWL